MGLCINVAVMHGFSTRRIWKNPVKNVDILRIPECKAMQPERPRYRGLLRALTAARNRIMSLILVSEKTPRSCVFSNSYSRVGRTPQRLVLGLGPVTEASDQFVQS